MPACTQLDDGTVYIEDGPTLLPQIAAQAPEHHGYGRPPLGDSRPERTEFVARCVDFRLSSRNDLARTVYGGGWLTDAARSSIKRDLRAGRTRLAEDGVLPWAAFLDGLPAEWWLEDTFAAAIDTWHREAILYPQAPPKPLIQRAAEALRELPAQYAARISIPLPRSMREAALRDLDAHPWRWPGA